MTRLVLALAMLFAACSLPEPVFATASAPIRESVGLVLMGDYRCSAVLVAPRLAVTAGHCVVLGARNLLGAEVRDANGRLWGLVEDAAVGTSVDVGLLVLDRPAGPGLALELQPPPYEAPLTLAGYGCSEGVLGLRRAYSAARIDPDGSMVIHGRACRGDSGGAVLDEHGRLVGIMVAYSVGDKSRSYVTMSSDLAALIEAATRTR